MKNPDIKPDSNYKHHSIKELLRLYSMRRLNFEKLKQSHAPQQALDLSIALLSQAERLLTAAKLSDEARRAFYEGYSDKVRVDESLRSTFMVTLQIPVEVEYIGEISDEERKEQLLKATLKVLVDTADWDDEARQGLVSKWKELK